MRKSIFILLALFPISIWAQSNLALIKDIEWKGECRKVVNEANTELKNKPYVRLQSSYTFQNEELIWWVKSFTDTKCKKINDGNKYTLKCEPNAKDQYAHCKQIKWENSKDGVIWEVKPNTDNGSQPDNLKIKVKIAPTSKNKVKLFSIGESEEVEIETLSH